MALPKRPSGMGAALSIVYCIESIMLRRPVNKGAGRAPGGQCAGLRVSNPLQRPAVGGSFRRSCPAAPNACPKHLPRRRECAGSCRPSRGARQRNPWGPSCRNRGYSFFPFSSFFSLTGRLPYPISGSAAIAEAAARSLPAPSRSRCGFRRGRGGKRKKTRWVDRSVYFAPGRKMAEFCGLSGLE